MAGQGVGGQWRPSGQQRSRVPPEGVERLQRVLQGPHPDHLDIVADRLPDLVHLGLGHEEHLVARVAHGDPLLGAAADRADGAVEVHRAGDRDPMPAGELTGGEHVEHREGEGQSRRGTADVPESMVTSIGRSAPTMRSSGAMPMIARSGSSAAATVVTSTSTRLSLPAGRSTVSVWVAPGPPGLQQLADLVGLVDGFTVDRDDHVVHLQHLRRRPALDHAPHDRAGGADVDILAEALERHRDGDELRGVHQLRVVPAVLGLGPAAADRLLRQDVDVVVEPAGQRLEAASRSRC